eukprot:2555066-Alexandrium_andersonii.AAC.1
MCTPLAWCSSSPPPAHCRPVLRPITVDGSSSGAQVRRALVCVAVAVMAPGPCSCGRGTYEKGRCSANCGAPEGPARRLHRLEREVREAKRQL